MGFPYPSQANRTYHKYYNTHFLREFIAVLCKCYMGNPARAAIEMILGCTVLDCVLYDSKKYLDWSAFCTGPKIRLSRIFSFS